jgi:hypothetical protein
VKGLRSHPRASKREIYARSCIRTSENSPSTHFVEEGKEKGRSCYAPAPPWLLFRIGQEPYGPSTGVRLRGVARANGVVARAADEGAVEKVEGDKVVAIAAVEGAVVEFDRVDALFAEEGA